MMKRGHTALEYKIYHSINYVRCVQIFKSAQISLWASQVKPRKSLNKQCNLIAQVNFDMSFSFIYSARPGTPAADMPDDVTEEEKKQRLYLLQERINQQAAQYSRRMLGTEQRVLVEGSCLRKIIMELTGRTENNRIVNFPRPTPGYDW